MRIWEINIDGFGQFAGRQFGPLELPVTVFFGPNEAGKSTLLEFIRRMMYGYPDGRSRANQYPPLMGGKHGGRIAVEESHGRRYDVRRTPGSRGGALTISAMSGEPVDEASLSRLLGHHSRVVFEQVFAFTLEELHSSELLDDSNVNSQIYSAGMGVTSLPNAFRTIDSEREAIFLNRGRSNQKTYVVCGEIDDIDKRLREVANNAAEYGELTDRQNELERELDRLAARRRQIQDRHSYHVTLKNAWDAWIDLKSAERGLAELPDIVNFPEDGVNRLETLQERVTTARREYESAELRMAEAEQAADVRVEHEAILENSSEVRLLQNGRSAFDGSVKDLPKRKTELETRKRALGEALKDLGPDWDETRLEQFDLSIAVRQEISEHGDRLRYASAEQSDCKSALDQEMASVEEAKDAENKAQRAFEDAKIPGLNADQIRQHRNLVRATKSKLDDISRQRQNVLNLKNQLDSLESTASKARGAGRSTTVAAGSFAFGLALLIGGAYLGGTALIIGVAAAIAFAGMGIYVLVSGKSGAVPDGESPLALPVRESIRRAEADIEDLQSEMMQEATPLNLEVIDDSSLLAAEQTIDEEEDLLQDRTRLSVALEAAKELAKQRQIRADKSAAAVEDADGRLKEAQLEWQEWAMSRGLSDTFTPETADVLQRQVELGRNRLDDVRSWRQRIDAIQKDIDEYVEAVEPLATEFDVTFDRTDSRAVAAAADRLVELMEEVQEVVRNRTDAELDLKNAQRQLDQRSNDLKKAEDELDHLLKSGGAEDTEAFRVRAGHYQRRAELDEKARTAHDRLQRLSGPGESLETLKADLGMTDRQSIDNEIAGIKEKRDTADAEIKERSTQLGGIQTELDGLEGEDTSSRLRMEKNVLLEQFKSHARDWTRLTLARNLLQEARRKFEQERQPGVVRHAQEFFTAITDGRYPAGIRATR